MSGSEAQFVSAYLLFKLFSNALIIKSDILKKKTIPSQKHEYTRSVLVVPVVHTVRKNFSLSCFRETTTYPSPASAYASCVPGSSNQPVGSVGREGGEPANNSSLYLLCGYVRTTTTLYKANAYSPKHVRFVQKKKQMNYISFPPVDNLIPTGRGEALVFANQCLKSSQFFEIRSGFKRLGINTKKIPRRSWAKSIFSRNSSTTKKKTEDKEAAGDMGKKYMYGELFLLYPTNSTLTRKSEFLKNYKREKGATCLNFVYNQIVKSLLYRQNSTHFIEKNRESSNSIT